MIPEKEPSDAPCYLSSSEASAWASGFNAARDLFAPILAEKEREKAVLAEEINRLRGDLDEAYKVLEPFDDALSEDDDGYPDDTKLTLSWRAHTDYSLTLGDLRRARAAAIRAQGE